MCANTACYRVPLKHVNVKDEGMVEGWTSTERSEVTSLHLSHSSTEQNRRVPELLTPASLRWKTRYYDATLNPAVTGLELLPPKPERKKIQAGQVMDNRGNKGAEGSANHGSERLTAPSWSSSANNHDWLLPVRRGHLLVHSSAFSAAAGQIKLWEAACDPSCYLCRCDEAASLSRRR